MEYVKITLERFKQNQQEVENLLKENQLFKTCHKEDTYFVKKGWYDNWTLITKDDTLKGLTEIIEEKNKEIDSLKKMNIFQFLKWRRNQL